MSKQTDLINVTDALTVDSSNNVGIGTSSPSRPLDIYNANPAVRFTDSDGSYGEIVTGAGTLAIRADHGNTTASSYIRMEVDGSEAMRIDSSGNLLVGTTDEGIYASSSAAGISLRGSIGLFGASRNSNESGNFNRYGTDGDIVKFRKDGSTVGSIGVDDNAGSGKTIYICSGNSAGSVDVGLKFDWDSNRITPCREDGINRDNAIDLGSPSARFDDVYATNGTIQTSDRNEKQDIEALSDAEQRVAVACKGLLRKFRWIDAVAEKGDNARIHFGIIAQDLQDAFTAEGLDAGRYAMFISSTWWETQTDVPAVEAVEAVDATYDGDGNELTPAVEAVEAKDAYTRTDTYETLEEAPEGATERTRLGVRYPELLAFIIGAT